MTDLKEPPRVTRVQLRRDNRRCPWAVTATFDDDSQAVLLTTRQHLRDPNAEDEGAPMTEENAAYYEARLGGLTREEVERELQGHPCSDEEEAGIR